MRVKIRIIILSIQFFLGILKSMFIITSISNKKFNRKNKQFFLLILFIERF
jgi:hypothetical protein